jgi:hypothetical protein
VRGKAALADCERLGQGVGTMFAIELFHQREACGGISADKTRPPTSLPCPLRLLGRRLFLRCRAGS